MVLGQDAVAYLAKILNISLADLAIASCSRKAAAILASTLSTRSLYRRTAASQDS